MNTGVIEKQILPLAPLSRLASPGGLHRIRCMVCVTFESPFRPGASIRGVIVPTKVDEIVAARQEPYAGLLFDITVAQIEPERLFSFRWHPFAIEPGVDYSAEPATLVAFFAGEGAEGIMLTVKESGFDSIPLSRRVKAFPTDEQGWGMVVHLLAKCLIQAR